MSVGAAVALALALASTTLTNPAYLRENNAAAELPVLCMRRPVHSARLQLEDRSGMLGFAMESSSLLLYAAALALAIKNCRPASVADAVRMSSGNGCRLSPPAQRGQDSCVSPHSPAGRLSWSFAGLPRQVCGR